MSLELTDTQKLRMIPEIEKQLKSLTRILAGNMDTGEIGLLEKIRQIADDIAIIKNDQKLAFELEKRIRDIEERHRAIDAQGKKLDPYKLAVFGMLLSNVSLIVAWLLGVGN